MTIGELLSIWIPIITVIIGLSFVFVDWPGWRVIETLIIGGGTGHTVVMTVRTLDRSLITPIGKGNYILIPAVVFGALMYLRFAPRSIRWLQRYGYAWVVGGGLGVVIATMIQGQILPSVKQAVSIPGVTTIETINNLIGFIIFVTTLSYFIFTREHKGALGASAQLGRYFLMIAFGLGFSTLLMTYFGVLLERILWILTNLGL
jgi:hypothetical protein